MLVFSKTEKLKLKEDEKLSKITVEEKKEIIEEKNKKIVLFSTNKPENESSFYLKPMKQKQKSTKKIDFKDFDIVVFKPEKMKKNGRICKKIE